MACNQYELYYSGSGSLSAFYRNCGDYTPFTISATGVPYNYYGTIIATTGSLTVYSGMVSALNTKVPGFGWTDDIYPWAAFALTSVVSAAPPTPTPSVTPTVTVTPSVSITPTVTPSISVSVTPTVTPTHTVTVSVTPSISVTPSVTPSISVSPSVTPSVSVPPTPTPSSAVLNVAVDVTALSGTCSNGTLCVNDVGPATVTVTGGSGNYTYSWAVSAGGAEVTTVDSPTASATSFSMSCACLPGGATYVDVVVCTVTDTTYSIVKNSAPVILTGKNSSLTCP